ncbi:MAG: DNA alkylation repair protein [Cytophagales bacterium]|nr:DNA alkylation repair protein [Cytophagales bacterium]
MTPPAAADVLEALEQLAQPQNLPGMRRFGINTDRALGVNIPKLRKLARELRRNHDLALSLWATEVHEARLLATMVADPKQLTAAQMEAWAKDFDSWDLCDGACGNLFSRTALAWETAPAWAAREEEFVRRAGFVLMATLAVHQKSAPDEAFLAFFPLLERYAPDGRNFVKKAVNWALRQIGKKNPTLRREAIGLARRIREQPHKSSRWIAADALRELEKK